MTTIAQVLDAVCQHFDLSIGELLGDCRSYEVSHPRQMAYLFCRKMTGRSSTNIARHLGNRDHSTILTGVRAAKLRVSKDPVWAGHYAAIRGALGL